MPSLPLCGSPPAHLSGVPPPGSPLILSQLGHVLPSPSLVKNYRCHGHTPLQPASTEPTFPTGLSFMRAGLKSTHPGRHSSRVCASPAWLLSQPRPPSQKRQPASHRNHTPPTPRDTVAVVGEVTDKAPFLSRTQVLSSRLLPTDHEPRHRSIVLFFFSFSFFN